MLRFAHASAIGALFTESQHEADEESVRIDVEELISEKAEQERRLQAESELIRVIDRERFAKVRKRAEIQDEQTPRKRLRAEMDQEDDAKSLDGSEVVEVKPSLPVKAMKQKKPRLSMKIEPVRAVVKEIPSYPCLFCPSLDAENLLRVFEPSDDVAVRSRSRNGLILAHLSCANSIPEVWIEDRMVSEQMTTVVMGANAITKDRWNLVRPCTAVMTKS